LLITGSMFLLVILIALFYFYQIQTTWVESKPYQRANTTPAKALVVAYSRTGNTFGAANAAARYLDADLLQIRAPQYGLTVEGQRLAGEDADAQLTTTPIQHDPVDLSRYSLIVLCAPTWWFRPAVPVWSFVENHNFSGKPVFLIMTGNSRYKKELTQPFATLVKDQNGLFIDMLFVRRGRFFWQKTPDEVNQEVVGFLKTMLLG
ncbi:MAG: hypothetical protein GY763_12125, partial [Gammaproteobacteria bacterium]|nr:hypothetical protein [Gammaproteobacteria bacterium]